MNSNLETSWQVWINDPYGSRLVVADKLITASVVRALNDVGSFSINLPAQEYEKYLSLDSIIEIWITRANVNKRIFTGFARKFTYWDDNDGIEHVQIAGPETNEILRKMIVAYKAGTAQAEKTGYSDDVCKQIVREALTSSATNTDRSLAALGFSVAADNGQGVTITKGFSHANLLETLQEIASASKQNGTDLYFDVVIGDDQNSAPTFTFQTYTDLMGVDHSTSGDNRITFSKQDGNLQNATLTIDYSDEITYVYAGGQGEGVDRKVVELYDSERLTASPWNRREKFVDARDQESTAGITTRANAALNEGRPYRLLEGYLIDTPNQRFGVEWNFGDKVAIEKNKQIYDAVVKAFKMELLEYGQTSLECKVEVSA